jgi:hypothetical protein
MIELPSKPRRVICADCGLIMQAGKPPVYWGICKPCSDRQRETARRVLRQAERRHLKKPPQTEQELRDANPFKGFEEE